MAVGWVDIGPRWYVVYHLLLSSATHSGFGCTEHPSDPRNCEAKAASVLKLRNRRSDEETCTKVDRGTWNLVNGDVDDTGKHMFNLDGSFEAWHRY